MPATRTQGSAARTPRTKPARQSLGLPRHKKNSRLSDKERKVFAQQVAAAYTGEQQGAIRQIADETGRSYGMIHRLLSQEGVRFRPRGGKPASAAPQAAE
ncbi:helix-turn-helix domain-containing protein [Streptomyces sp. NPDC056891]|uniref:helix-turn-helix domain-containing protein n=1 Tax=Streptomyces sp. NPDC056891 TaxID=3345961 RepID=UPI00368562EA